MPDGFGKLTVVKVGACGRLECGLVRGVGSGLGSPVCVCFLAPLIQVGLPSVHVLCPVALIVRFLSWVWAGCSEGAPRNALLLPVGQPCVQAPQCCASSRSVQAGELHVWV